MPPREFIHESPQKEERHWHMLRSLPSVLVNPCAQSRSVAQERHWPHDLASDTVAALHKIVWAACKPRQISRGRHAAANRLIGAARHAAPGTRQEKRVPVTCPLPIGSVGSPAPPLARRDCSGQLRPAHTHTAQLPPSYCPATAQLLPSYCPATAQLRGSSRRPTWSHPPVARANRGRAVGAASGCGRARPPRQDEKALRGRPH